MSDRIAVFDRGRVEQLATPVELYEHPASAFVAGFVGTSNRLTGEEARGLLGSGDSVAIRPEKLRIEADGVSAAEGEVAAPGVVREVVYVGPTTHSIVELDAGPRLTVSQPNTDRSIRAALARRDQPVTVVWRRDAQISLTDHTEEPEETA